MKRISKTAILALLLSAAVMTPYAFGDATANAPSNSTTTGVNGPSDTLANGVVTGKTTTGSTPPSPNVVVAPNTPAAASSGAPYTSPTGAYKGTGSSPQNQSTGSVKPGGSATNP
jgi:hypothetical protein